MSWGEIGTLASILGVFIGASTIIQAVLSHRPVTAMHRDRQRTQTAIDDGLKQVLSHMETNAEARDRDLKDRLGGTEGQP
jgi:hypothetical protein